MTFKLDMDFSALVDAQTKTLDRLADVSAEGMVDAIDEVHTDAWAQEPVPERSRRLKGSLTDVNHEDHFVREDEDGVVTIGSDTPYARKIIEDQRLAPDPNYLAKEQAEAVAKHLRERRGHS